MNTTKTFIKHFNNEIAELDEILLLYPKHRYCAERRKRLAAATKYLNQRVVNYRQEKIYKIKSLLHKGICKAR